MQLFSWSAVRKNLGKNGLYWCPQDSCTSTLMSSWQWQLMAKNVM